MKRLLLVGLTALVGVSVVIAAEKSDPKGKAPEKTATPIIATPVTAQNVPTPAGTPEELMELIRSGGRQPGDEQLEPADRLRFRVFTIAKAADRLQTLPKATKQQQAQARRAKLEVLFQASRRDTKTFAAILNRYVAELVRKHPKSEEAALGEAFQLAPRIFQPPAPKAVGLPALTKYAKSYPESRLGVELFGIYAEFFARTGKVQDAIDIYRQGVALYAKNRAVAMLRGPLAKLEIIGKPMKVAGPTLAGSRFNLASLKGKVVLVDFWATWCGPCVRDLPSVKSVYEKYRDKGFEVVGISLDHNKEELADFVKDREVPWPQIIFAQEKERGWNNPLARAYGVNSIPATFLIDRSGNVVTMDIRGTKALEEAVQRLLAKSAAPLAN